LKNPFSKALFSGFPYVGCRWAHAAEVRYRLRQQLAQFLKRKRGDQTFQQFARKIGLSDSTLQRIEMMEQNVTIDTIQQIVNRLRCRVADIFPE
jgi:transcriptional regulator with XRE-family HTH domain